MPHVLFATAFGPCGLAWNETSLTGFVLPDVDETQLKRRLTDRDAEAGENVPPEKAPTWVQEVIDRVQRHLAGDLQDFAGLRYDFASATAFQRQVYEFALTVKPGHTRTYGDVANALGLPPGGARSVDEVRHKLDVLRGYCAELGRPAESLLRTHFTSWLMLSDTEVGARAKLDRYHPSGLSEQQKASRIAGTPETAIRFYQALVDVGIDYFIVQIQDAADAETLRLLATAVAPHVRPSATSRSNGPDPLPILSPMRRKSSAFSLPPRMSPASPK